MQIITQLSKTQKWKFAFDNFAAFINCCFHTALQQIVCWTLAIENQQDNYAPIQKKSFQKQKTQTPTTTSPH